MNAVSDTTPSPEPHEPETHTLIAKRNAALLKILESVISWVMPFGHSRKGQIIRNTTIIMVVLGAIMINLYAQSLRNNPCGLPSPGTAMETITADERPIARKAALQLMHEQPRITAVTICDKATARITETLTNPKSALSRKP